MPTLVGREVGPTGFGLMSLTAPGRPTPREHAFKAMNTALDNGANFWNGGQFYGTPDNNSLHLLREYFSKYPENAERVVLSVKGGLDVANKVPNGSPEFVRSSVEGCLEILPPSVKRIDIFQCARVDPKTPIETTMQALKELRDEGKFGNVGLSEVRGQTIERASKIVSIAAVEVEFSLFETRVLTNGVAATCAKLNIPLIPYSPLGRGILTGKWTTVDDIPQDSMLARLDKYQGDALEQNLKLVHALQKLSQEHEPHTMGQLAMSWIQTLSNENGLPVMVPIFGSTKSENVRSNMIHVDLTQADMNTIKKILDENQIVGDRAYPGQKQYLEG